MRKRPSSFEEITNADCRWPKQGDRFLRRGDCGKLDVEFVEDPTIKHVALWHGYLSAARGLIDLTLQDGYEHERANDQWHVMRSKLYLHRTYLSQALGILIVFHIMALSVLLLHDHKYGGTTILPRMFGF